MTKLTLKDLSKKHKIMDIVYREQLHESLDLVLSVYVHDIVYDGKETQFILFLNDNYIYNAVSFPCDIPNEDILEIAKDMVNQYRNTCDLSELDMELKGIVPCEEFKNTYSTCDDCHRLSTLSNPKDNGCLGVTYRTSDSFGNLEIQTKWKDKYGENSPAHKKHLTKKLSSSIHSFGFVCGDDKDCLKNIIETFLNHSTIYKSLLKDAINECINQ